jgi:hypothetical protein
MGNSLASAQASMTASLETYRLIAQNAGLPYTFPDGTGTIQTRDQTQYPDISNINGRVSEALILSLQNDTTTTINFRDEQNITHAMTAPQIIAMGTAVSQFVTNTYTTKWAKEVEISQLTEENYQSYDITEGW